MHVHVHPTGNERTSLVLRFSLGVTAAYIVLLVIAGIFGARAGVLGTVLAALVFAAFLFGPTGNLSVASDSARSNLGWMLLIGLVFSFLFAPPSGGFHRH